MIAKKRIPLLARSRDEFKCNNELRTYLPASKRRRWPFAEIAFIKQNKLDAFFVQSVGADAGWKMSLVELPSPRYGLSGLTTWPHLLLVPFRHPFQKQEPILLYRIHRSPRSWAAVDLVRVDHPSDLGLVSQTVKRYSVWLPVNWVRSEMDLMSYSSSYWYGLFCIIINVLISLNNNLLEMEWNERNTWSEN